MWLLWRAWGKRLWRLWGLWRGWEVVVGAGVGESDVAGVAGVGDAVVTGWRTRLRLV